MVDENTYSIADVSVNDTPVGRVWTNNNDELEFEPVAQTNEADRITALVESAKILGLPADRAYASVLEAMNRDGKYAYTQAEGPAPEPKEAIAETPLPTPYRLVYDENNVVTGLALDDDSQAKVRENGQWVDPISDDDPRYWGTFEFVTDNAVPLYDKLVSESAAPTLDDFQEVRFE